MARRLSPRMATCLATAILIALVAVSVHATTIAGTLNALRQIQTRNPRIYTASIATHDATGVRNDGTGTIGADATKVPILPDSSLRGNFEFDHLLVSVAVQNLITRQFMPQPDSTITSTLLPRGVNLIHPAFTNTPMTLRQLLTHTTGLQTNSRFDPSPQTTGTGNVATDFNTFCDVFVTQTSTGYTQATDIWTPNVRPGTAAAYKPNRANTMLLAYMVQQVINTRPTLITSAQKTVGAYIQEFVINGMGLSSTYMLQPDGSVPYVELGLASFTGSRIAEHTAGGVVATTRPLHPATVGSGVMIATSAADISKLMYRLFIQGSGTYTAIGASLLENVKAYPELMDSHGITHLGFGINKYSPSRVCDYAANVIDIPSGCTVGSSPSVVGYTSVGTHAITGAFCTNYEPYAPELTTANAKVMCSGVTMATNPVSGTVDAQSTIMPAIVGAANEAFIDPALTEGSTIREKDQKREWDYGLLTFAYIVAILLAVFVIAYFSEYYVQPAPVVGHLSAGAYPTLDQHYAKADAMSRRR